MLEDIFAEVATQFLGLIPNSKSKLSFLITEDNGKYTIHSSDKNNEQMKEDVPIYNYLINVIKKEGGSHPMHTSVENFIFIYMPSKEKRPDFYNEKNELNKKGKLALFEEVFLALDPTKDIKQRKTNAVLGRYFGVKLFQKKEDEDFNYKSIDNLLSDVFGFEVRRIDGGFEIKYQDDENWKLYSGRVDLLTVIYGLELQKLDLNEIKENVKRLYEYFNCQVIL